MKTRTTPVKSVTSVPHFNACSYMDPRVASTTSPGSSAWIMWLLLFALMSRLFVDSRPFAFDRLFQPFSRWVVTESCPCVITAWANRLEFSRLFRSRWYVHESQGCQIISCHRIRPAAQVRSPRGQSKQLTLAATRRNEPQSQPPFGELSRAQKVRTSVARTPILRVYRDSSSAV